MDVAPGLRQMLHHNGAAGFCLRCKSGTATMVCARIMGYCINLDNLRFKDEDDETRQGDRIACHCRRRHGYFGGASSGRVRVRGLGTTAITACGAWGWRIRIAAHRPGIGVVAKKPHFPHKLLTAIPLLL